MSCSTTAGQVDNVEIKQRSPILNSRCPRLPSSRQLIACGSADQSLRLEAKRSGLWRPDALLPPLPDPSHFRRPRSSRSMHREDVIVVEQKGKLQLFEPRYVDPSFLFSILVIVARCLTRSKSSTLWTTSLSIMSMSRMPL